MKLGSVDKFSDKRPLKVASWNVVCCIFRIGLGRCNLQLLGTPRSIYRPATTPSPFLNMSVFDCLKKNTRLPLYVPPLRWREEHLEHLRVSQTISKLEFELPTIPSDILEALNPIPGTPAPRSKKYVDLRWFCESAIFELLETIGLSYKYYAQTDGHRFVLIILAIVVFVPFRISYQIYILASISHWRKSRHR